MSTLGDLLEQLDGEDLVRTAERLKPYLAADDPWLDVRAAANHAGCTVPALRHAIKQGAVEVSQSVEGGKIHVRRSAVDRWRSQ